MTNAELKRPRRARRMQQHIREMRKEGHREIAEEIARNLRQLGSWEKL